MNENWWRRFVLLAGICIPLTLFLITVLFGKADGYYISFYNRVPVVFWGLVVATYVGTVGLGMLFAYERTPMPELLIPIVTVNLVVFSLPFLFGDFAYTTGDDITHLADVKHIIENGEVWDRSIYPLLHILMVEIYFIINIKPPSIFQGIVAIAASLIPVVVYLPARELTTRKENAVFLSVLAGVPILADSLIHFTPFSTSTVLFVPLFLCILYRIETMKSCWLWLFVGSGFFLTFSHPLIVLLASFLAGVFSISHMLQGGLRRNKQLKLNAIGMVLIFILGYTWLESRTGKSGIGNFTRRIVLSILGIGKSKQEAFSQTTSVIDVTILEILQAIVFRVGPLVIIYLISVAIVFVLLLGFLSDGFNGVPSRVVPLCIIIASFCVVAVVVSQHDMVIQFNRVLILGIIFPVLLTGHYVSEHLQQQQDRHDHRRYRTDTIKQKLLPFVIFGLLIMVVIVPFTVYDSPDTSFRASSQVTFDHYAASEWVLERSSSRTSIGYFRIDLDRMEDVVYGRSGPDQNYELTQNLTADYYLQSDKDIAIYTTQYHKFPGYYPYQYREFINLNNSRCTIYDSGGANIRKKCGRPII